MHVGMLVSPFIVTINCGNSVCADFADMLNLRGFAQQTHETNELLQNKITDSRQSGGESMST